MRANFRRQNRGRTNRNSGWLVIALVILLALVALFLFLRENGGSDDIISVPTAPPTVQILTPSASPTDSPTPSPSPSDAPTQTITPSATIPIPTPTSPPLTPTPVFIMPGLPPPVEIALASELFGTGLPPVTGRFGGLYNNRQITNAGHIMLLVPEEGDSASFAIDAFEVTALQLATYLNTAESRELREGIGASSILQSSDGLWRPVSAEPMPAVGISAVVAWAYCKNMGASLPTLAEWQRAAFWGGEEAYRAFPWGDAPPDRTYANFASDSLAPRQSFEAGRSWIGAYHMAGNAAEWVQLEDGGFGIIGGSYQDTPVDFEEAVTTLVRAEPDQIVPFVGFRCVREPE